jgi:ubiquinone/menaquinone biosynthesis C-methylase UbiE
VTETQTQADPAADQALKAKHRAMWALGDYPAVATEVIAALGPVIVEAAGITAGQRVLDVAAGSGNAAIPAARTGAQVVASDLTPELLEAGRAAAAVEGLDLAWEQADAEALPYADDEFDAVISVVGVMFAPHHQAAADELVRVCRPGGTIGLISWTPEGFIGRLFATMKPYVAPPPAGVQPPPLWGSPEHVTELFADRVTDLRTERRSLTVDRFPDAASFRDFFKACYGPTIAAYKFIAADAERVAALDQDLLDLAARHLDADSRTMEWEYLLVTAEKA